MLISSFNLTDNHRGLRLCVCRTWNKLNFNSQPAAETTDEPAAEPAAEPAGDAPAPEPAAVEA